VIVLAPSRGRPDRAKLMVESFLDTRELGDTELVLVTDETDLTGKEYQKLGHFKGVRRIQLWGEETGCLTAATNTAARRSWSRDVILGHVGDDHLFRTAGWDGIIEATLPEPGIAYGDDLLQGELLPTAVFMSSVIPRTLGWMALPGTRHMYIDNAWKELGKGLGALHYRPDVIIEHMHPGAGKAESDEGYERADGSTLRDAKAYARWLDEQMGEDLRRLKEVIQ
jgi:hypothetical protein